MVDLEDLCGSNSNNRLRSSIFQSALLDGIKLRYRIIGDASPNFTPIVFTPGGQTGVKLPKDGLCIHPTRYLKEDELRSEYCLGTPPPSTVLRSIIAPIVRQKICACGLITQANWTFRCNQVKVLEQLLAMVNDKSLEKKYFFVTWDRRNHGGSEIKYSEDDLSYTEPTTQSHDLKKLIEYLGFKRAVLFGTSSGSRLSLTFACMFPEMVESLVLTNMTNGDLAANFLAQNYYRQFAELAAGPGGMSAVVQSARYSRLIDLGDSDKSAIGSANERREALLKLDPTVFIKIMKKNCDFMLESAGWPVIGITQSQIEGLLETPALVVHSFVPEDGLHTKEGNLRLATLLPKGEFFPSQGMQYIEDWGPRVAAFIHASSYMEMKK